MAIFVAPKLVPPCAPCSVLSTKSVLMFLSISSPEQLNIYKDVGSWTLFTTEGRKRFSLTVGDDFPTTAAPGSLARTCPFLSPCSLIAMLSSLWVSRLWAKRLKRQVGENSLPAWQPAITPRSAALLLQREQATWKTFFFTVKFTYQNLADWSRNEGTGGGDQAFAVGGGRKSSVYDRGMKTLWVMNEVRMQ